VSGKYCPQAPDAICVVGSVGSAVAAALLVVAVALAVPDALPFELQALRAASRSGVMSAKATNRRR
jgi:hypothetical protein